MNSPNDRCCSERRAACRAGRVAAVAATVALASCSLIRPHAPPPAAAPSPSAPVAPLAVHPTATHRFTFDPAHEDVVGVVQVTTVGAEDTLPDIARRFNVGYE